MHHTISKHCCWVASPIFHGDNYFDVSFDGLKRILLDLHEMSGKVTVMNEVNNFASLISGIV